MFSELDAAHRDLKARGRGIALGTVVLIAVAASLVAPRAIPFALAAVVVGCLGAALVRSDVGLRDLRIPTCVFPLLGFLAFAMASAAWAVAPLTTVAMTGVAALITIGSVIVWRLFATESGPNLAHIAEGAWIGYLIGVVYLLVELSTGQVIKVGIFNALGLTGADLPHAHRHQWADGQLVSMSMEDLTRNIAPATLLLWPALMIMRGALARVPGAIVAGVAVVVCGADVFLSWHGTSKLAFLAGGGVFLAARLRPDLVRRLLSAGWVVACLGAVPLALAAHSLDLHQSDWLEHSARHRIVIWNFTAEKVLSAPVLGIGARSTYTLGPRMEAAAEGGADTRDAEAQEIPETLSTHAHNIYLQTWLELGLVGAVLLTFAGLALLKGISALDPAGRGYACAGFAAGAVMAASSYGMWQVWFVGMFALSTAMLGLGYASSRRALAYRREQPSSRRAGPEPAARGLGA